MKNERSLKDDIYYKNVICRIKIYGSIIMSHNIFSGCQIRGVLYLI